VQVVNLTTDIHPVLRLEGSYISSPSACLHKVDRGNFII
jgi:hypothetical protein